MSGDVGRICDPNGDWACVTHGSLERLGKPKPPGEISMADGETDSRYSPPARQRSAAGSPNSQTVTMQQ